jgi:hypothetical protein
MRHERAICGIMDGVQGIYFPHNNLIAGPAKAAAIPKEHHPRPCLIEGTV